MSKHVTDVTSRQECCRAQSLHRLEADPHQTTTLPLVLPVYPAVPDLPEDLDPLDEEEVRDLRRQANMLASLTQFTRSQQSSYRSVLWDKVP